MGWRYIAAREIREAPDFSYIEEVWTVREYYEKIEAWTESAMRPYGTTREDLIHDLEMMLEDVKRGDYLELSEGVIKSG